MTEKITPLEILGFTSEIVSSYSVNNSIEKDELPHFIQQVYKTIVTLSESASGGHSLAAGAPAVPIEESCTDDYIICLEDGKKLQVLKRHLKTSFNLTIEEYKKRWGLGPDYPTVAPNYARRRSQIAKNTDLGKKRGPRLRVVAPKDNAINS